MSSLDLKELRAGFSSFMTGVTIITAKADDGTFVGFTANSFTSVSLDPPLLLVCPGNHLSSIEVFRNCRHFAVSILREGQEEISNIFARSKGNRFAEVNWKADSNGAPLISEALATFSCTVHDRMNAGDHLILVGEVNTFTKTEGLGLGYWKGGYFSLGKEREAQTSPASNQRVVVGAVVECEGSILVLSRHGKLYLPSVNLPENAHARPTMTAWLQENDIDAEIGRVYSVYHDTKSRDRFIYFRATCSARTIPQHKEFVPLEVAANAEWVNPAEGIMVRRYLEERRNNQFGLYVGDTLSGEIHSDENSQL